MESSDTISKNLVIEKKILFIRKRIEKIFIYIILIFSTRTFELFF